MRKNPFEKFITPSPHCEGQYVLTAPTVRAREGDTCSFTPDDIDKPDETLGDLARVLEQFHQASFHATIEAALRALDETPSFNVGHGVRELVRRKLEALDADTIARNDIKLR